MVFYFGFAVERKLVQCLFLHFIHHMQPELSENEVPDLAFIFMSELKLQTINLNKYSKDF